MGLFVAGHDVASYKIKMKHAIDFYYTNRIVKTKLSFYEFRFDINRSSESFWTYIRNICDEN
jgi:hypothetical protein